MSACRAPSWIGGAVYAAIVGLWFAPLLFAGETLFFRDITYTYFPNYVFLEAALGQGVWPLWNPQVDGGAPFLASYPIELVLVGSLGASGALALGPALHMWTAMWGARALCRHLGVGEWGAFTAGALFGLSGYLQSCVNLLPLLHACALAPLVILAALRMAERPSRERVGLLALVLALQVSTQAGEIVLQSALFVLALWPTRRIPWRASGTAALLALAMLAPVLAWATENLGDTARGHGLDRATAFADAASAPILLEALLPRFFGDVHAFGVAGFWGQPFFPNGFPYVLSLYLGLMPLVLALRSGRRRLLVLALLGTLLALGAAGPFEALLEPFARIFRAPVKLCFVPTLALCLAAGAGLERAGRRRVTMLAPGLTLLAAWTLAAAEPTAITRGLSFFLTPESAPLALDVVTRQWPGALATGGGLALGVGLALVGGSSLRPLAVLLLVLDLAIVNGRINESAPPDYFELQRPTRVLVERMRERGPGRLFSLGVASASRLSWSPAILRSDTDRWLYYLDRQSLAPRTHVLDGWEGAFDEDRLGLAPSDSTLHPASRTTAALGSVLERLRWGGVRYLLSFDPLPAAWATPLGEASLPQVAEPLRAYELANALPPAFYVAAPRWIQGGGQPRLVVPTSELDALRAARFQVRLRRPDVHRMDFELDTPPGYVVVLEGFHRGWRLEGPEGPIPILPSQDRAWAFPTPGGAVMLRASFRPRWLGPALLVTAMAALAAIGMALHALHLDTPRPRALTFRD